MSYCEANHYLNPISKRNQSHPIVLLIAKMSIPIGMNPAVRCGNLTIRMGPRGGMGRQ